MDGLVESAAPNPDLPGNRPTGAAPVPGMPAEGAPSEVEAALRARDDALGELRRSEERYRALIEATGQAVWIADTSGGLTFATPSWAALTGQSEDEARGWGWLQVVHPDDRARAAAGWQRAVAAGTVYDDELRLWAPDGSFRDFTVRGVPIAGEDSRIREWVVANTDVTESRRAQEALRSLAEASTVLAASLDYETTLANVAQLAVPAIADQCIAHVVQEDGSMRRLAVVHENPAREALVTELMRRYEFRPDGPHPIARVLRTGISEIYPEMPDAVLQAIARDEEHLRHLRKIGLKSAMYVPLRVQDRRLGVLTFGMAESGWRYRVADLTLAEDLARRAALAIDNARLYREARAAIRTRDEFLSTVSHDLKNPLASVKGFAQLLLRQVTRAETVDREQLLDGLRTIDETTTRMTALINELVDIAYVRMGQPLTLDRRPDDLVSLARRIVDAYQKTTGRHRLRVVAEAPELVGSWDVARLGRVLENLISNAIKFSPRGGEIILELRREGRTGTDAPGLDGIDRDGDGGSWAVLTVHDRGLGIPAADLPLIFDRFHRGRNVAEQITGTGIGLASVRQIVEQHGGTIAVESEVGIGSTFTVRLPLSE